MRTIRNVGPESIDQYMEVYLNSYPAFKSLDDDCYAHYEEKTLLDMTTDPDVDFVGMFEDEKMIAIMKVVHFRINLFGRMQSAYGLMSLGVHPLYKKQHAALEMVREFERRAAAEGTLLTLLLPFRMDFYRGMGYGYGTRMDEYRIPVASLPKAVKDTGRRFELELAGKDAVPEMVDCYNAVCADNHGALQKFSEEARLMGLSASPRRLVCRENGEMVGYLVWHYDQQNDTNYTLNTLVVEEMVYADGDVLQQLLSFLRKQADLAQSLVLRTGEEDFYHLLEDAADTSGNYIDFGYLQTNVSAMGSMYKIFDPERFIKGTLPVERAVRRGEQVHHRPVPRPALEGGPKLRIRRGAGRHRRAQLGEPLLGADGKLQPLLPGAARRLHRQRPGGGGPPLRPPAHGAKAVEQ